MGLSPLLGAGTKGSAGGLGSDQAALDAQVCLIATADGAFSPASGSEIGHLFLLGTAEWFIYKRRKKKKEGTKGHLPGVCATHIGCRAGAAEQAVLCGQCSGGVRMEETGAGRWGVRPTERWLREGLKGSGQVQAILVGCCS